MRLKDMEVRVMKIKTFLPIVALAVAFSFAGCRKSDEVKTGPVDKTLSVQETRWYETGSTEEDPVIYNPLEEGDVVFDDGYYRVEIESVSEDLIVLSIDGCLVEANDDGTINLRADSLEKIELAAGESITLVSQTMDAGTYLLISYE